MELGGHVCYILECFSDPFTRYSLKAFYQYHLWVYIINCLLPWVTIRPHLHPRHTFYSKEMQGWNTEDDVFFCTLAFGSSMLNRTVKCPAEDSAMVLTRGQHHSRLDMACVLNSQNIWHYLPMMHGSENQEVGGTLSLLHLISNLKDFGF